MEVLWTFMVGMITSDKVKKRIPDRFFWQKLRFLVFGYFSVCKCNNLIIIRHLRFRFIVIFPNLTFAFDKRRVFLLFDNLSTGPYNEIQDITASL